MAKFLRFIAPLLALFAFISCIHAQSGVVVFGEPGFPTADSAPVSEQALRQGFTGARMVDASQLPAALNADAKLLVLPYGSAYPEAAWPAILRFLDRGGDLIVLGGKPFTRAAYREGDAWKLRQPSVAASFELFIEDYQETPGSKDLRFEPNADMHVDVPAFAWRRGYSPIIRLSVTPRSQDIGTTGKEDAYLTTLAWGTRDGHRLSAPAFLVDHVAERFEGGRWIFVACDGDEHALDNAQLLSALRTLALRQEDRFTLRPRVPLFLPGEPLEFRFQLAGWQIAQPGDELKIRVHADDGRKQEFTFPADPAQAITLPASAAEGSGLHVVDATLMRKGAALWTYRSGFWMRDVAYLTGGPKLTVDADHFLLDGKALPVVGTTYMASDVHRLYLTEPNAYVWDQDMKQIRDAGLNMLRSGIWTGWDLLTNPDSTAKEETLRAVEAFLMTARWYGLPVQFNLFAFLPDAFGGGHAYLSPQARERQDRYVTSLVSRFHDVPFLAWDLINEPSANKNFWRTSPDAEEQEVWSAWLKHRYPDQAALQAAWVEPSLGVGRALQSKPTAASPEEAAPPARRLPDPADFSIDAVRSGYNPLKVYDYFLFTQSFFGDWVRHQRDTIRAAGSQQLITVGQDEGGVAGRLSPAFYGPDVSFTATHTWWDFDSILWAGLSAKMPGRPMLVQETGEQRRLLLDGHLRLSAEEEARQLERKLVMSFAQGAGAIEWVWDVNAMMANGNEITIGAVRPDGTEKPEAQVLAGVAQFAAKARERFGPIEPPAITLVASQAEQYSVLWDFATEAQKKVVRTVAYFTHQPLRILAENRLAELGHPKLVILPSAQALTNDAWRQLLAYVADGGCLLVTGPVQHEERWQIADRLAALGVQAEVLPLAIRQSKLLLPGYAHALDLSYPSAVQTAPIEVIRFADGASLKTIPHGNGSILWAADPVELAEGYEAAAALYRYAEKAAGVAPVLREAQPLSPGVLAFATVMRDAILYSFSSECLDTTTVDVEDAASKARLRFTLQPERAALVLLDRATGAVLASYGADLQRTPEAPRKAIR